jgi:hypothetical protein
MLPLMAHAPQSTAAFDELLALLGVVRDQYVRSAERFDDEIDVIEGYRYVTELLSEASELFFEGDPERPRFSSIAHPARKFLGDNPDALYQQAVIRGDRSYRITGRRTGQDYISFTIHGPDPAGGINGPVLADRNDRDFTIDADGRYEIILSPEEHQGNWIKLEPDARIVIVRNYFLRERSVQLDPDVAINIAIEPLDDPGPPPPLDDATFAQRLRDGAAFVRATTLGMRVFGLRSPTPVPFVSDEPNTVGTPWSFRSSEVDAAGAVDIYYSSGTFDLGPDEALVMEGTLPDCLFANVMLWNVQMQTLEYRHRRCSLNAAQIESGADGGYRIVVSARDPGVPNWIDTGGHRHGTIFWRFLLPSGQPETPRCRVVPIEERSPGAPRSRAR